MVDLLRGPGSAAHADSCTGNHLPASLQLYQGMGCTHPLRLHQNELMERDALHAGLFQVWMDLSQSTAQTHPNCGDLQHPAWPVSPVGHPPAAEASCQRGSPLLLQPRSPSPVPGGPGSSSLIFATVGSAPWLDERCGC